ncbi:hypothetical protein L150_00846 [Candida albicans Ca529L]|nr:hypothetical protein L150_00846 [Candida albicans Ca529L]
MIYIWHALVYISCLSSCVLSQKNSSDTSTSLVNKSDLYTPRSNRTLDYSPLIQYIPVFFQKNYSSIDTPHNNDLLALQSPATTQTDSNKNPQKNDSVLDECHFMSFEEWKKQKIESNTTTSNNYSMNGSSESKSITPSNRSSVISTNVTLMEADGKVYKDKFNFASVDCAATIMKTNAQAKGASAILKENKDSYLLNECSVKHKYVIIELCQDILVDSVVIGNFEFFSSIFKDIRISVSDRFPSQNWKELGQFTASNIRDVQTFKIENPLIWARYLKLEILSHYGNEFYCPISIVRVHGKTMMDEFKEDEEGNQHMGAIKEEEPPTPQTIEEDVLLINQTTLNECRVRLPHLQLNEFLKSFNSSNQEFCVPSDAEPQVTTAKTTTAITTQESIYKNIMKRLSLLESNATLSLLYIEEQSKLLSTAFSNLEKRQTTNFNTLISSVNSTLMNQLMVFKESYYELYEQYGNLFKMQENSHRQLLAETNKKVGLLSSELTFQKRVSIFNSIIIICLLVYVILTRDVAIEYPEDELNEKSPSPQSKKLSSPFIPMRYKKSKKR